MRDLANRMTISAQTFYTRIYCFPIR